LTTEISFYQGLHFSRILEIQNKLVSKTIVDNFVLLKKK